jgi:metallo-beta-lactamase class B
MPNRLRSLLALVLSAGCLSAQAAEPLPQLQGWQVPPAWLTPITPVQISDHVWQLGVAGITTLLFKTEAGAVLIDGGMPQAAPLILDHLKQLGVAPSELKLLLHSHAHADHVGSTAALQRATGAVVVSNAESAVLMARGGYNDLHYGDSIVFPPVTATRLLQDREVVQLGSLRLQVWFTPGHTPGSMSWTWTDTRAGKTTSMYAVGELMRYASLRRLPSSTPEEIAAARMSALKPLKAVLLIANVPCRDKTINARIRHLKNTRLDNHGSFLSK